MRRLLTLLLLAVALAASADLQYWGGPYGFGPLSDATELEVQGLVSLPVPPHASGSLLLSALTSSPDGNLVRRGGITLGMARADSAALTLTLKAYAASDPLYDGDALEVVVHVDGESTPYRLSGAGADKLRNGRDAMLALSLQDGVLTLLGGSRLQQILWSSADAPCPAGVGEFLADASPIARFMFDKPGSPYTVRRASVHYDPPSAFKPMTAEEIEAVLATAERGRYPYAGFWSLLDYDLDDNYLRPGGRYILALLPFHDGYRGVYISGADVAPSLWHPGMRKADMAPTSLPNAFTLEWIDVEGAPLPARGSAQFATPSLLNIAFPGLSSTLRLHRIPNPL